MADREMSSNEMRAVELLMQLQALSPEDATNTVRISIRMADGSYVGDALLSANAVAALNDATLSLIAYRDTQAPIGDIDPLLEADFAEYCIGLDVDGLVAMAALDPKEAVAGFDEITGWDQDGDL